MLASRIGRTVREIHAPVSAYDDPLADAVDRFMDRLRVDRPMWRLNWAGALAALPEATVAEKGLGRMTETVTGWLERRIGG